MRGGWDVLAQFHPASAPSVPGCTADDFVLGEGVLERIASTESPQPNLALVSRRSASLARLEIANLGSAPWVLFLDAVSDPGNLGTILRSAEAMGASGVVLGQGCVDAFNPKVVRASAGALFHVPVIDGASLSEVKSLGYWILATSSHDNSESMSITEIEPRKPVCVVLGNEAHGVSQPTEALVDGWIRIEQHGRSESLNVAMAATIINYELSRRRR